MLDIQSFIWVPKIIVDQVDDFVTRFEIQYLPRWFWHSLWNAFRRILLWYSAWWAITGLKVSWAPHEYHVLDGVKESVIDIMLNFKKLRFQLDESVEKSQWLTFNIKWIGVITAKDINLPAWVTILNPEVTLFEISDPSLSLTIDFRVEKGYGYYSLDMLRAREEKKDSKHIWLLLIDNDFKAVNYVRYEVEDVIDDFSWSSKDKLILEVKTISSLVSARQLLAFAGEVLSSYAKLFIFDDIYIDKSLMVDYYDIAESTDKMMENMNIKTVPIDALPLSERTRNALIKNGILYVEDLEKKRRTELLWMKWIWRKAVDEIIDSLEEMWKTLE